MNNRRRGKWKISVDRDAIVEYVDKKAKANFSTWVQREEWMRPGDVEALVKAGRLEREVRREYDSQRGYGANLFGGAGVVVRHRAYLRIPKEEEK